jgi:hypothetical protein
MFIFNLSKAMKYKKNLLPLLFTVLSFLPLAAQTANNYEYMNISVIESLIAAGAGRSRMLITSPDGKTEEVAMSNFFSLGGINFGNISENDQKLLLKFKDLAGKGWEVFQVTAGATDNIFITRYLLRRAKS